MKKLLIALSLLLLISCNDKAQINVDQIDKIVVSYPKSSTAKPSFDITDKDKISQIASAINSSEETEPHKCASFVTLTINSEKYQLLRGHEEGFCEVRKDQKYQKLKLNEALIELLKSEEVK